MRKITLIFPEGDTVIVTIGRQPILSRRDWDLLNRLASNAGLRRSYTISVDGLLPVEKDWISTYLGVWMQTYVDPYCYWNLLRSEIQSFLGDNGIIYPIPEDVTRRVRIHALLLELNQLCTKVSAFLSPESERLVETSKYSNAGHTYRL